ncbi:MAG: glycosyltransferase family 4 protein [FCB group bacterium]|nr:glycosyltransferase family 4 protein [FCB group bacterium]
MHLAIDCRMYYASGIGTYLKKLVPLIIALRPDIKYSLIGDKKTLSGFLRTDTKNVNVIDCNAPIYSLVEQYELIRKIPPCDLFFSPHYNIPLLYRGKLLITIHDIFHLAKENQSKSLLKTGYARIMLTMALKKSQAVMVDSRFTLAEMYKYKLPYLNKVKVVYLGFGLEDTDYLSPSVLPENGYLLYIGNVKPHKNLHRLVEAYKLLFEEKKIDIPLIIVGEEKKFITGMPELIEEIIDSRWRKWIKFTGWVSDSELVDYYRHAVLMVQPSLYEGFGLPPLEAMACGCPCVVSKAASLPEVCGDAVLYCDPYNVNDIADKISRLLVNEKLRAELIEKGWERVKLFSWEKTAEKVLKIIDEVTNPKR